MTWVHSPSHEHPQLLERMPTELPQLEPKTWGPRTHGLHVNSPIEKGANLKRKRGEPESRLKLKPIEKGLQNNAGRFPILARIALEHLPVQGSLSLGCFREGVLKRES